MRMLISFGAAAACLLSSTLASPAPQDSPSATADTEVPQESACGYIVNTYDNSEDQITFDASLALACLSSVPFDAAVASQFVSYWNDTLQFQSNLAYLKNPPEGYQQPPTDLLAGLQQIQNDIDAGAFHNQYAFEAALQLLLLSANDAHLHLTGGILAAFSFGVTDGVVSVSSDGVELPKVYLEDDLLNSTAPDSGYDASAIATVNGQSAFDYFSAFAVNNAMGVLEANAAWNQAMSSPVLDVLGSPSLIEASTTLYPGDTITLGFENGTTQEVSWQAFYNSPGPTGPLATPGDFYNFFVLGFYPASFTPPDDSSNSTKRGIDIEMTEPTRTTVPLESRQTRDSGWQNTAYPVPDVAQPDLSTTGNGFLSGYFYNDECLAVLSIPSFDQFDVGIDTFTQTVSSFISQAKGLGLCKLIIDLQQNTGGDTFLAIDTFKQFFPTTEPFLGSRLRAHPMADAVGDALTSYWDSLSTTEQDYYDLSTDEFVSSDRINALTGQNFTSWAEFFGPTPDNGDLFTTVQQYNLSSFIFDVEAKGGEIQTAVFGYDNNPANYTTPPFAATDIILLTDGLCSSACALFAAMMTHDAGARTVTAGGLPLPGPIQAVAMNRGAAIAPLDSLDGNINFAASLSADPVLPNRTEDTWVRSAGVNLRDQLRPNDSVPAQFKYQPADCRIYYTPASFYNFTNLWLDAANAAWTDPARCVPGSTGYTDSANPPPPPPPFIPDPSTTGQSAGPARAGAQLIPLDQNTASSGSLADGVSPGAGAARSATRSCTTLHPNDCPGGKACQPTRVLNRAKGISAGTCPSVGGTADRVGLKQACDNCAPPPRRRRRSRRRGLRGVVM